MGICDGCKKQTVRLRSNPNTDWDWLCDRCYMGETIEFNFSLKEDRRALHWNEIRSRVTTHEGEFLSGKAGREYQKRWSSKYLGRDLGNTPKVDRAQVEKFIKTKT